MPRAVQGKQIPDVPLLDGTRPYAGDIDLNGFDLLNCPNVALLGAGLNTFTGDVIVQGDFVVNGTTFTVNSTVVDIADRIIHLNHSDDSLPGDLPVPSNITGFSIHRGDISNVPRDHSGLFWDEPAARWKFAWNTAGDDSTLGAFLDVEANYVYSKRLSLKGTTSGTSIITVAATTPNITYTLPTAVPAAGQLLSSDGSGNLSWVNATSTPAGANTQVQYNNLGSMGASLSFTWNNGSSLLSATNIRVGDGTVSAPSYGFLNDTNTGLYLSASDQISISCGGVQRVAIDGGSAQWQVVNNFSAAYTFNFGPIHFGTNLSGDNTQLRPTLKQFAANDISFALGYNDLTPSWVYGTLQLSQIVIREQTTGVKNGVYNNSGMILSSAGRIVFYNGTDLDVSSSDSGISRIGVGSLKITAGFSGSGSLTAASFNFAGSTSGTDTLQAAAVSPSVTYTLPATAPTAGQVLSSNGTGTMSWITAVTSAAGINKNVQFNNSGSFGGDSDFNWDTGSKQLTINATDAPTNGAVNLGTTLQGFNLIIRDANFPNLGFALIDQTKSAFVGFRNPANTASLTSLAFYGNTHATFANTMAVRAAASSGYSVTVHTDGVERVRVDTSGRVGIGTTTPTQLLDLFGDMSVGQRSFTMAAVTPTAVPTATLGYDITISASNAAAGTGPPFSPNGAKGGTLYLNAGGGACNFGGSADGGDVVVSVGVYCGLGGFPGYVKANVPSFGDGTALVYAGGLKFGTDALGAYGGLNTTTLWVDGSNVLMYESTPVITQAAGSPTQVQFNTGGSFDASADLTWSGTTFYINGKLTVTGAIDPTSVLLSGGTALYYESNNGSTAPVSGAATGRIRYNNTAGKWQVSTQGSAYADISTGGGTVTSVALSLPSDFSVAGSPVTTSGTFTVTYASQTANTVFAAPSGSAGTPSFRSLVALDIPNLDASKITTGTLSDSRLSANVTLQGNTFNGASQLVQLTAGTLYPALNGSLITNLNGSNVATGTVADARLSSNVALKNIDNAFSVSQTFTGIAAALATKTTTYTLVDADFTILGDAAGGAFTATLPTPVGRTGKLFCVKRINSGANKVTVGTAAGTIDGAATKVLNSQYDSITVQSDGSNWFII